MSNFPSRDDDRYTHEREVAFIEVRDYDTPGLAIDEDQKTPFPKEVKMYVRRRACSVVYTSQNLKHGFFPD